jgi:tRNA(Ile)-lysidine synthetase-like protein
VEAVVGLLLRLTSVARTNEKVRAGLRAATARLPDLFAPGTRLVVAYSGGQDSTCLLHALMQLHVPLDLVAVHVDHALRMDSARDAERASELARGMGVGVEVHRVDVAAYRRGLPGWSVQQAARAARYQVLANAAHTHDAAAVLVAHTADDQAETLLINLIRGAGLAGLSGMRLDETLDPRHLGPPPRELPVAPGPIRLARPLLRIDRSTTLAYCAEQGLSIVEDASNVSRAYARNRVRLDLLPALERFNPAIRAVLARTADLAAEDVAALDVLVAELHARLAHAPQPDVLEYDLQLWRAQPRALQRRLLRYGLNVLRGNLADVRAAPIDDALDVVRSGEPGQTYHLPHGVELRLSAHTFRVRLHGRARSRGRPNTWGVEDPRV